MDGAIKARAKKKREIIHDKNMLFSFAKDKFI